MQSGVVLALLALAGFPAIALASTDHWFAGPLGAFGTSTSGYASFAAHSISYIEGDADHNGFCVGREQGATGYNQQSFFADACASSGGTAAAFVTPVCCNHANIANTHSFSITVLSATHYDY